MKATTWERDLKLKLLKALGLNPDNRGVYKIDMFFEVESVSRIIVHEHLGKDATDKWCDTLKTEYRVVPIDAKLLSEVSHTCSSKCVGCESGDPSIQGCRYD